MRDEVQRWLSFCIMAGYDTPEGDTSYASFEVDAPTLEALCRRWLAVEDAPVVCAGKSAVMGEGWQIYGTDGDSVSSLPIESGQRVRIVPDPQEVPDGGR